MRVSVYRLPEGKMSVLVEASTGRGLSPVMVEGVTSENVVHKVLPLVTQMRRPKTVEVPPAG